MDTPPILLSSNVDDTKDDKTTLPSKNLYENTLWLTAC